MGTRRGRCFLGGVVLLALWCLAGGPSVCAQDEVSFLARQDFAVGAFPVSVTVGDFNADGHLDLAVANFGSSTVSILLGQGDGTFQAAPDVPVGVDPASVAVGDFNADGRLDLATANFVSDSVSILLNTSAPTSSVVNALVTFVPCRLPFRPPWIPRVARPALLGPSASARGWLPSRRVPHSPTW